MTDVRESSSEFELEVRRNDSANLCKLISTPARQSPADFTVVGSPDDFAASSLNTALVLSGRIIPGSGFESSIGH
jgi:hypothetical protein